MEYIQLVNSILKTKFKYEFTFLYEDEFHT